MDSDHEKALRNPKLWVRVDARSMPRTTEIEIASAVLSSVRNDYGSDSIQPSDILGAQYFRNQNCWIIYMSSIEMKIRVVSVMNITFNEKQYSLSEFITIGWKNKSVRISIHGIPMHVSNKEVEQWVDQFVDRDSSVEPAKAKKGVKDSLFSELYTGNRFCFAKHIRQSIPRYTTFMMADPIQINQANPSLIELDIVVYHEGQPINCWRCKEEHDPNVCPKMNRTTPLQPRPKLCYSCGLTGHIALLCPKLVAISDEHENAEGEEDEYDSAKEEEEMAVNQAENKKEKPKSPKKPKAQQGTKQKVKEAKMGQTITATKQKAKEKKRMLEQQKMKMEHVKRDQSNSHHQAVRKLEKVRKQKD